MQNGLLGEHNCRGPRNEPQYQKLYLKSTIGDPFFYNNDREYTISVLFPAKMGPSSLPSIQTRKTSVNFNDAPRDTSNSSPTHPFNKKHGVEDQSHELSQPRNSTETLNPCLDTTKVKTHSRLKLKPLPPGQYKSVLGEKSNESQQGSLQADEHCD